MARRRRRRSREIPYLSRGDRRQNLQINSPRWVKIQPFPVTSQRSSRPTYIDREGDECPAVNFKISLQYHILI